jgi:arylsulfatase A-like enzyme
VVLDDLPVVQAQVSADVIHVGDMVTCETEPVVLPQGAYIFTVWWIDDVRVGLGETLQTPDAEGATVRCDVAVIYGSLVQRGKSDRAIISPPIVPGNILVLVADDVGVDRINSYGMGQAMPPTPHIDALAAQGVRFTRAWATPSCSPTRATFMTGRYGFRTGFGKASNAVDGRPLDLSEVTLAEVVTTVAPYATAAVGKWHLSNFEVGHGDHVIAQGFGHHRGNLSNLREEESTDGLSQGFFDYEYHEDGEIRRRREYITTVEADDTITFMETLPEPWFIYTAFHASHSPVHIPPRALYTGPELVPGQETEQARYAAITEALDTELGRILERVPPDTTVIFLGDNGTEQNAALGPYPSDEVKLTMREGGVRIPLIVTGPHVTQPGRVSDALVHTVDIFSTVAHLAGVADPATAHGRTIDGVSLLPYLLAPDYPSIRDVVYTERFIDNGFGPYTVHKRAVRDDRYKLLWNQDLGYSLFDIGDAWTDGEDLLDAGRLDDEAKAALERLTSMLEGDTFRRDPRSP